MSSQNHLTYGGAIYNEGGDVTITDCEFNENYVSSVYKPRAGAIRNEGTMTITNNDVALNVYNHNGGNLVFDLKYGTAVNGAYSYTFDRGENGAFGTGHNRLVNGGTITVNNGTLNLNKRYDYGDMEMQYEEDLHRWAEKLKRKSPMKFELDQVIDMAKSHGIRFHEYDEMEFYEIIYEYV